MSWDNIGLICVYYVHSVSNPFYLYSLGKKTTQLSIKRVSGKGRGEVACETAVYLQCLITMALHLPYLQVWQSNHHVNQSGWGWLALLTETLGSCQLNHVDYCNCLNRRIYKWVSHCFTGNSITCLNFTECCCLQKYPFMWLFMPVFLFAGLFILWSKLVLQ